MTGVNQVCATCRHAYDLEIGGHWCRHGFDHGSHTHCRQSEYGTAQVMRKLSACSYQPCRWEEATVARP